MILKERQNTYFRFKKLFSHCKLVKSQRKWLNGHVGEGFGWYYFFLMMEIFHKKVAWILNNRSSNRWTKQHNLDPKLSTHNVVSFLISQTVDMRWLYVLTYFIFCCGQILPSSETFLNSRRFVHFVFVSKQSGRVYT